MKARLSELLRYLMLFAWYRFEYGWHMTDAYLASNRGDGPFAADSETRAHECERKLVTLRTNIRYWRITA